MDEQWTLPELVGEVATRIAALPTPRNGQVRAIPDDRTIRYYGTIGLLDRPLAMRGRTALYGRKHLAQVVAIKRMQLAGRSLAEIQAVWPTLDDDTLSRMAGVALTISARPKGRAASRAEFWKTAPQEHEELNELDPAKVIEALPQPAPDPDRITVVPLPPSLMPPPAPAPVELRIELAPNVVLTLAVIDERVAVSPADIRAIRAAAAPLVAELARRQLTQHAGERGE